MVYHLGNQRVTPCNGLLGGVGGGGWDGVQPKRGTIFMLGISLVEVNERVGKSVTLVGKMT